MNSNVISSVVAVLIIVSCAGISTAQWTPDPFCPFPSDHVTRYPYYGNCSIYWECYNGAKYVMACPEGLEFNAPYQRCDAPEIAKCDPFASTTANPNPPTYTTGPTDRTTSSNGPDPMCPYPSEELVYFPYPGDCTKYWECYEGNKYLQVCPDGLWWHEEISECDYPGSFCDNTTSIAPPTTHEPTTASPTTTVRPTSSSPSSTTGPKPICPNPPTEEPVYFPVPGDCTKYWECSDGKEYEIACPSGLWWHQEISECDYPGPFCDNTTAAPSTTSIKPTTASPTTTAKPTTAVPTTEGPTTEGPTTARPTTSYPKPTTGPPPICPETPTDVPVYFPYVGDCTKYWECSDGKEYELDCPSGLWWHQEISECDYPGPFCDPRPFCPNTPTDKPIFFPYDGDCTKYWECSDGKKYELECPSGLWWHQEISECDYPGSYCDNTTATPSTSIKPTTAFSSTTARPTTAVPTTEKPTTARPTTARPTTAVPTTEKPTTARPTTSYPEPTTGPPPICPETPTDVPVYFPYVGDCTKYWECSDGKEYELDCPSGLWWHQELSECDYPGPFCNPGPICPDTPTDVPIFYPYDGDCTKYWECSDGKKYELDCPSGLWWHQEISECDYPGSFCDNSTTVNPPTRRSTTVTVAPPTTDTPIFICNGTATSYWPHPSNCHRYIECLNGDPYFVDCPPKLYFSDNLKECVSDEKSECCKVHEC